MKNDTVTVQLSLHEADVLLSLLRYSDRFVVTSEEIISKVDIALMEKLREVRPEYEPSESMDGDFDSAMESAGHGTDEDYNHYSYED
jgi:hypothetical protein